MSEKNSLDSKANESALNTNAASANGIVLLASETGNLYAFNASSGSLKWTYNGSGSEFFTGVPCVKDSVAYLKSSSGNYNYLHAVNIRSGKAKWVKKISTTFFDYSSAFVSNDNIIYVSSGPKFLALNAADGNIIWTWNPNLGRDNYFSYPTVINGSLYVTDRHNIYSINPSTGAVKWSYADNNLSSLLSSICVHDDLLFYSNAFSLISLDTNGIKKWELPITYYDGSSPTYENGVVYTQANKGSLTPPQYSYVYAVNAQTGQMIWQTGFESDSSNVILSRGSIFFKNNKIYMTQRDSLVALNGSNGKELWSSFTGIGPRDYYSAAGACGNNNVIYVTGMNHKLYAINTTNGQQIWSADYGDTFNGDYDASPVFVSGLGAIHPTISGMQQ